MPYGLGIFSFFLPLLFLFFSLHFMNHSSLTQTDVNTLQAEGFRHIHHISSKATWRLAVFSSLAFLYNFSFILLPWTCLGLAYHLCVDEGWTMYLDFNAWDYEATDAMDTMISYLIDIQIINDADIIWSMKTSRVVIVDFYRRMRGNKPYYVVHGCVDNSLLTRVASACPSPVFFPLNMILLLH